MNIDKLLSRLDKVKTLKGGKYLARCPAHDDKSPSLAIKCVDGDKILLKCWSGCDTQAILSAIGLTFSDLFPERPPRDPYAPIPKPPKFNVYELFPLLVQEAMILAIAFNVQYKGERTMTVEDFQRVEKARDTIMNLHTEVAIK